MEPERELRHTPPTLCGGPWIYIPIMFLAERKSIAGVIGRARIHVEGERWPTRYQTDCVGSHHVIACSPASSGRWRGGTSTTISISFGGGVLRRTSLVCGAQYWWRHGTRLVDITWDVGSPPNPRKGIRDSIPWTIFRGNGYPNPEGFRCSVCFWIIYISYDIVLYVLRLVFPFTSTIETKQVTSEVLVNFAFLVANKTSTYTFKARYDGCLLKYIIGGERQFPS